MTPGPPPRIMQFQSQMASPLTNLCFHIQRKSIEVRQTLGDTAQAEATHTIRTALPIAVVEVTVAGARAPGRNRQRTVCRLKQNGLSWILDTIRPKKQVSSGSFVKAALVWFDLYFLYSNHNKYNNHNDYNHQINNR